MTSDTSAGRRRFAEANKLSIMRAFGMEPYSGMEEFKEDHLNKYVAIKIPKRPLSVGQCELIIKYIAEYSSDPGFDTLAHLSYLGFNSLMYHVDHLDVDERSRATRKPFFHKYSHYREDWLTLRGSSKLFDKSMMEELANKERAGEFKDIKLKCLKPAQSDYCKLANIGYWAVSFLKLLAIEKAEIRNQHDTTRASCDELIDLPYKGECFDIYRFPKIDLSNVRLPLKDETLYLFYRGAIISEHIEMCFPLSDQRSIILNAGFAYLRCYKSEAVAQFYHIWNTNIGCSIEEFFIRLYNDLPKGLSYLESDITSLVYHWCKSRMDCIELGPIKSRYTSYARLFNLKYYEPYGAEGNELLVAILIGAANGELAPQLKLNQYKVEGDSCKEAERFGRGLRLECTLDNHGRHEGDRLMQIIHQMTGG